MGRAALEPPKWIMVIVVEIDDAIFDFGTTFTKILYLTSTTYPMRQLKVLFALFSILLGFEPVKPRRSAHEHGIWSSWSSTGFTRITDVAPISRGYTTVTSGWGIPYHELREQHIRITYDLGITFAATDVYYHKIDRRQHFRRIIAFLFKNMDDPYDAFMS